jgi:hypothetical protein
MKRVWLFLLLCLAWNGAAAQDQVYRLEPRKVSDIAEGKAVLIDGKAGPKAHRFLLDGLTVYTPVLVTLRPVRRGDDIRLKLGKTSWEDIQREGSTQDGQASFKLRTEGEFLISVDAAKADLPYKLLVWVGDEVKVAPPPAVVPKSQLEPQKGAGLPGGAVLWIIAVVLLGIFALLMVIVLRRKSS